MNQIGAAVVTAALSWILTVTSSSDVGKGKVDAMSVFGASFVPCTAAHESGATASSAKLTAEVTYAGGVVVSIVFAVELTPVLDAITMGCASCVAKPALALLAFGSVATFISRLPARLDTGEQYDMVRSRFGELLGKRRLTAAEERLMALLGVLIEDYDRRHALPPDDDTPGDQASICAWSPPARLPPIC